MLLFKDFSSIEASIYNSGSFDTVKMAVSEGTTKYLVKVSFKSGSQRLENNINVKNMSAALKLLRQICGNIDTVIIMKKNAVVPNQPTIEVDQSRIIATWKQRRASRLFRTSQVSSELCFIPSIFTTDF